MSLFWCSQIHCLCRRRKDVSKLKIRPLEEIKIGGTGALPVFTACIYEILENLPPFGQDLCQIWYHQCTVMTDVMYGFYKKTPTPATFAFYNFLTFTIASMSADSELQKLVREFEQEGLPHLFSHPPASATCEETPLEPTQPMQTRSNRKKI